MEHQVDKLRVAQQQRMSFRKRRGRRGNADPMPAARSDLKVLDASAVMPR